MKLILLLIGPSALLVTIVIWAAYSRTMTFLHETQDTAIGGTVQQVVRLIETQMNDLVLNMVGIEGEIKLNEPELDVDAAWEKSMETVVGIRSELIRAAVFIDRNRHMTGYPGYFWGYFSGKEQAVIDQQAHDSQTNVVWSDPFNSTLGTGVGINRVSVVSKEIVDDQGSYLGVLAFVVDVTNFLQRSAAFSGAYDTQTLLYDRQDRLIYSIRIMAQDPLSPLNVTDKNTETLQSAAAYFKQNGKYFAVSGMEQAPYWKVVVVGDVKTLERQYSPFLRMALIVFVIGGLGLVFIYVVVSWWFTKPIAQLTRGVRYIAKGNLDHHFEVVRKDEFGELAHEFNRMMRTIQDLIATLKITEEQKRQSDFQVLLSQINPHFLYNTLNTIDMMVDVSEKPQLHEVIRVLGRLLQYGLDRSADVKPLRDELTNVRDYLFIQSVRYANRFAFTVPELTGELAEVPVLKLVLQPIVENAVFHGLHPLTGRKGMLTITVESGEGELFITVADNGVGMDEARSGELAAAMAAGREATGDRIGLRNVHKRIQLYYGPHYGLRIESEPGRGTRVILRLKTYGG